MRATAASVATAVRRATRATRTATLRVVPSEPAPAPVRAMPPVDRTEAVRRYAPLVKHVVDRIAVGLPKVVDMDDLMNAAIIGLLDALDKYDESKGTKFETYAVWRIRGAVLDELRTLDWA